MSHPIPTAQAPGIYKNIEPSHSAFVEVPAGCGIRTEMQYSLLHMKHAESLCLVREEVLEKLLFAQKQLPEGVSLCVLDAWRPFLLQKELYETYAAMLTEKFGIQSLTPEDRKKRISDFVSEPVPDRLYPPVHTTGGAVDLTLVDATGRPLPMGTAFDDFSEKAATNYFESHPGAEIRANRRLLYHTMISAGFTNLPSEWWHYDYGDRFWAYYAKKAALYEGVFSKAEMK